MLLQKIWLVQRHNQAKVLVPLGCPPIKLGLEVRICNQKDALLVNLASALFASQQRQPVVEQWNSPDRQKRLGEVEKVRVFFRILLHPLFIKEAEHEHRRCGWSRNVCVRGEKMIKPS